MSQENHRIYQTGIELDLIRNEEVQLAERDHAHAVVEVLAAATPGERAYAIRLRDGLAARIEKISKPVETREQEIEAENATPVKRTILGWTKTEKLHTLVLKS